MKVDVVLLTLNSVKPCLRECIESVYANVPVNRLIVVDGGSTDGTVDFLSKYPNVKFIYDLDGNRATSRQVGIGEVETEFLLSILASLFYEEEKIKDCELKDPTGCPVPEYMTYT